MNEPGSSAGDGPSVDEGSVDSPGAAGASTDATPQKAGAARPGITSTRGKKKTAKEAKAEAAAAAAAAPPEAEEHAKDAYVVALPTFEGPLDLLLHLIQKHELDILDIPVSFITEKYLAYINVMKELTIDVASEYLVMAATLTHIKSKMLLPDVPQDQGDGDDEEMLDPREELVRRLLEYQKYKAAAEDFGRLETLGKDVFQRGETEPEEDRPAPFAAFGVFDLLSAFSKILEKTKSKADHEIVFDRISITDRIMELTDVLKSRRSVPFEELFGFTDRTTEGIVLSGRAPTRFDVVITFLAVLEMCRMRMMRVYQAESLSPIHVELLVVDEDDEGIGERDPHHDAEPRRPDENAEAAAEPAHLDESVREAPHIEEAGEPADVDESVSEAPHIEEVAEPTHVDESVSEAPHIEEVAEPTHVDESVGEAPHIEEAAEPSHVDESVSEAAPHIEEPAEPSHVEEPASAAPQVEESAAVPTPQSDEASEPAAHVEEAPAPPHIDEPATEAPPRSATEEEANDE